MRKAIAILSAATVLMLAMPAAVLAHGHGGGYNAAQTARYSVCAVEECTQTGLHYHNGTAYVSHYYGDGHDYHDYCGVADCTAAGYHEHDGVYCFGHTNGDGRGYNQSRQGCCRRY